MDEALFFIKRETGIGPATLSLARRCSTAEPLAHVAYNFACCCFAPIVIYYMQEILSIEFCIFHKQFVNVNFSNLLVLLIYSTSDIAQTQ